MEFYIFLCYSVKEAYNCFCFDFARVFASITDWQDILTNKSFNIWWRYITLAFKIILFFHKILDNQS